MKITTTNPRNVMSKLRSIMSVGKAAATIQHMPDAIYAAADVLKVRPTMRINGVAYYTERDVERIGEHLRSETNHHAAS